MTSEPASFLGLPSPGPDRADALILPLPIEKTVSYGKGTAGGPRAVLEAGRYVETFDEETHIEFADAPWVHVLPPVSDEGALEDCLARIRDRVQPLRGKFLLGLGGEHSVTHGMVAGLADDLADVTVVQIDAHADLADTLNGLRWSHGTVMRRLWEQGCRLIQIGIRSQTKSEYELASSSPRITTFYAHELPGRWAEALERLRCLEGPAYLTIDVDGLDPSVVPSTGTPVPDGLSWRQTIEVVRAVMQSPCRLLGADIVEFVPSPIPPGCDPAAARLALKVLAFQRHAMRESASPCA